MNCHEFRAAILDMDGVITQTAKVHARAWKRMFDDYLDNRNEQKDESHAPFDIDHDYREYVDGKPRYAGVKSFLDSRGIVLPYGEDSDEPNRETICGLGNRKNELLHELLDRDGVETYEDTLEQIGHWKHDGVKVAVISSSRNCEAVLKAANVLELFDAKVDGNDLAREHLQGKPAARHVSARGPAARRRSQTGDCCGRCDRRRPGGPRRRIRPGRGSGAGREC